MSLNNLSLSPHLLADLYGSVLVQGNAKPAAAKASAPFLGKNEKQILILVNKKETAFLPDKELQFLTQVLSACGLNLDDVAIVNWHSSPQKNGVELLAQFHPQKVLLLDVEPSAVDFPATPFYSTGYFKELPFVAAPALQKIEKSKDEKKGLWAALKQLFCI